VKLATNIYHVSANCWTDFHGHEVSSKGHAAWTVEILWNW